MEKLFNMDKGSPLMKVIVKQMIFALNNHVHTFLENQGSVQGGFQGFQNSPLF